MSRSALTAAAASLVVAGAALAACGDEGPVRYASAERGHDLIERFGCGSCHVIDGVDGANGRVGPPLTDFEDSRFIAGRLPNTPQNAVRWILNPQAVEPRTIMPNLGLTPGQAEAIVEYLYTQ